MKRAGLILLAALAPLLAQDYRDDYRNWRSLDPTLESQAAQTPQLAERAAAAGAAAKKYAEARAEHIRMLADDTAELRLWIQNSGAAVELDLAPASELLTIVTGAQATVAKDIATYATDTDRGIQLLKQALEREKESLASLSSAIGARQKAAETAAQTVPSTEAARNKAQDQYKNVSLALTASLTQAEREKATLTGYYQELVDVAKDRKPVAPEAPTPVTIGGVRITNPAKPVAEAAASTQPGPAAPAPPPATNTAVAAAPKPPIAPLTPTITPVPLSRYIGEWMYPAAGGLFYGTEPASVALVVSEQNQKVTGSLDVRFKLPAGSKNEPTLHLEFAGGLKATRNQIFTVTTGDASEGTIELIPGPAFNLLEVTFQTTAGAPKIGSGNFLLIKK